MSDIELHSPMVAKYQKTPPRLVSKLTDFACCVIVALPIVYLRFIGVPYKRGFFCKDESITLPHKPETISDRYLALICIVIPALVIALTEAVHYASRKTRCPKEPQSSCATRLRSNAFINDSAAVLVVFVFGLTATLLLTDISKFSLGVLRPHFLSVCHPNWSKINCSEGYITGDFCEGDPDLIKKARLSFPSGHASMSAFAMVFVVLYVETKMHVPWSKFLKFTIQILAISFSMFCGYSRIFDNMHHWSDVLAGFALGTVLAVIFAFRILSKLCQVPDKDLKTKRKDEGDHKNNCKDIDNNLSGSGQFVVNLEHYTYDSDSTKTSSI